MQYFSMAGGIIILILVMPLVSFTGCSREPQKVSSPSPAVKSVVQAATTTLAVIADDERPVGSQGPSGHAGIPSDEGRPVFSVLFSRYGGGVAYSAQKGKRSFVVHNGRAGRPYDGIGDFALSPDGLHIAYGSRSGSKWKMVIDEKEGDPFDELGTPVFSPDGRHVAYEARKGYLWHIVVDGRLSPGCESYYEKPVFSPDSTKVLRIENTSDIMMRRFLTSDLAFSRSHMREFRGRLVVFSRNNRRVAMVVEMQKGKRLLEFDISTPEAVTEGAVYDDLSYVSLSDDGARTAYVAIRGQERYLVFNGKEEKLPPGDLASLPEIRPDGSGVGIFLGPEKSISLYHAFIREKGRDKTYMAASDLVYSDDGTRWAYAASRGREVFIVVNGREGEPFDMVVEPLFSPDGMTVVYRARKDGRRFVVVAGANGETLRKSKDFEQVFQPVFINDGKSVAYGVKDGNKLIWMVEAL